MLYRSKQVTLDQRAASSLDAHTSLAPILVVTPAKRTPLYVIGGRASQDLWRGRAPGGAIGPCPFFGLAERSLVRGDDQGRPRACSTATVGPNRKRGGKGKRGSGGV